jgi:thymidylate kinase
MKRLSDKKKDYFETKEKLTAIRNSYLRLATEQKWKIMSGVDDKGEQRTREDIHEEIWRLVQPLL